METCNNILTIIDKQQIVVLFKLVGLKMQIFKEKIPAEEFKLNKVKGKCFSFLPGIYQTCQNNYSLKQLLKPSLQNAF